MSHREVTTSVSDREAEAGWSAHCPALLPTWSFPLFLGLVSMVGFSGCGAGGDTPTVVSVARTPPPEPPSPPLPTEPPPAPPTSYELQHSVLGTDYGELRRAHGLYGSDAIAYGDFDGDGDEDVFAAPALNTPNPKPVEMYLNVGGGEFRSSEEVFLGEVPTVILGRKSIPGDFNADGRLDVFVAGHGYDEPPFPGERPLLLLSAEGGLEGSPAGLENLVGFHHGAASGDVDYDGDLDIVVTNNFAPGTFLLLNDGSGSFSFDQSRLPDLTWQLIFTAEILDVDGDLWPDLLLAGHEFDEPGLPGWPTTIYWGDPSGTYEDSRKTVLPAVAGQGVVVDIDAEDLDGDGNRDIVLNRTSDDPFYEGYFIQIVASLGGRTFADETPIRIEGGADPEGNWFTWLRLQDVNRDGYRDIWVDDEDEHGWVWLNDGSGFLRPDPERNVRRAARTKGRTRVRTSLYPTFRTTRSGLLSGPRPYEHKDRPPLSAYFCAHPSLATVLETRWLPSRFGRTSPNPTLRFWA